MPGLTFYSLRSTVDGEQVGDFDDYVERGGRSVTVAGPVKGSNFEAKLYVMKTPPHEPQWAGFLKSGFMPEPAIPRLASAASLLIVKTSRPNRYSAFAFGMAGRFMLKEGCYERGFGLRTALNLLYRGKTDAAKLVALQAKRHGAETMRQVRQSSRETELESFDLDRFRDLVSGATGSPADKKTWGARVTGADAFHFAPEALAFSDLGGLCKKVYSAHKRTDYRGDFSFIDDVLPVAGSFLREELESLVVDQLQSEQFLDLDLAPPVIVDWTVVEKFRYSFESQSKVTHSLLRLNDFVGGLKKGNRLSNLSPAYLRSSKVTALDGDGTMAAQWAVWRCLSGEVEHKGSRYILDEGDFYEVSQGYLSELDAFIGGIASASVDLQSSPRNLAEKAYNALVTSGIDGRLNLDTMTITIPGGRTPIEICDILTADRSLIHVKKHLGSRDLSHHFAQGYVSADLLENSPDFRTRAQAKIDEISGGDAMFKFFSSADIDTSDFEVVLAVVTDWKGRTLAQALPFFSKVNLRRTVQDLRSRRYRVAAKQVGVEMPR